MTAFDVLIVGGGISGVATAYDAALRGLSVALLEKNSVGSGTSSKTSKLAHGGLRYLEQYEFNLVKEAIRERDQLLIEKPDFVKPLPFVFPIYQHQHRSALKIKLGLMLYDWFSKSSPLPKHQSLTSREIEAKLPGLSTSGLRSGFQYFDAQMDDLGLVKELTHQAKNKGVEILEHTTVTNWHHDGNRITGLSSKNRIGEVKDYFGKVIVNTTGPWANELLEKDHDEKLVSPSKGVHIILPELVKDHAVILSTPQDNRVFFVMPYHGHTLVGTTDTLYDGHPDDISVTTDDVSYLLDATRYYFKDLGSTTPLDAFVGLRPLLMGKGSASEKSRDFLIHQGPSGLLSMSGGKYTTHRLMAEKLVDKIFDCLDRPKPPCPTKPTR